MHEGHSGEKRDRSCLVLSCPVPGATCSQPEILGSMVSSTSQVKESTGSCLRLPAQLASVLGGNAIHTLLVSYYPHFLFCIWDSVSTHRRPPTATFSQGQLRGLSLALHLSEVLNNHAKHRRRLLPNINLHSMQESCPAPPTFMEVYFCLFKSQLLPDHARTTCREGNCLPKISRSGEESTTSETQPVSFQDILFN